MDFTYSEDERRFQQDVRAFLRENWDPEVMDPRREGMAQLVDTPARRAFMRKMAERGFIGLSWPKEYGGSDAPGIYEYLLNEELAAVGAPLIGKGVGIVGKTIMRHGSEEMKRVFLPKILAAEIEFAIGYTEPDSGSDLASLKTRATQQPDGSWRISGQKRFTTSAHFADWYWLAVRTNPDVPKHKGISLFLIPMDSPGITITNMDTIGDERVNEVFLDDVPASADAVVGEVDKGWYYVSEALDYERFTLYTVSAFVKKYELARAYLRDAERDGLPLRDDPDVRKQVAWWATHFEIAKMHMNRVVSTAAAGGVPNIESAMFKLWTTTLGQRLADGFLSLNGAASAVRRGSPGSPLDGRFEHSYRYTVVDTIGAGTSEVQKNIIARRGLGLPVQS